MKPFQFAPMKCLDWLNSQAPRILLWKNPPTKRCRSASPREKREGPEHWNTQGQYEGQSSFCFHKKPLPSGSGTPSRYLELLDHCCRHQEEPAKPPCNHRWWQNLLGSIHFRLNTYPWYEHNLSQLPRTQSFDPSLQMAANQDGILLVKVEHNLPGLAGTRPYRIKRCGRRFIPLHSWSSFWPQVFYRWQR